jgi:hypothetical protein
MTERNRRRKRIHETRRTADDLVSTHALGAHIIRHDFGRVDGLHRCECEGEDGAEHKDEADGRGRACFATGVDIVGSRTGGDR